MFIKQSRRRWRLRKRWKPIRNLLLLKSIPNWWQVLASKGSSNECHAARLATRKKLRIQSISINFNDLIQFNRNLRRMPLIQERPWLFWKRSGFIHAPDQVTSTHTHTHTATHRQAPLHTASSRPNRSLIQFRVFVRSHFIDDARSAGAGPRPVCEGGAAGNMIFNKSTISNGWASSQVSLSSPECELGQKWPKMVSAEWWNDFEMASRDTFSYCMHAIVKCS